MVVSAAKKAGDFPCWLTQLVLSDLLGPPILGLPTGALLLEETELIGDLAELIGDVPQFPYNLQLDGLPIGHPSSELCDQ